ncbi:phosphate/phosphite/phosphonate ABC transporter substrate-binding protein [bacterium]|nr:phosphate/phosphite/phosphonate ABC transporter substrate-binding protein [bacterium]
MDKAPIEAVKTRKFRIRFGRVPYGTYADVYRDHQDLIEYLSKGLDSVGLQLYADYAAMVKAIAAGELELAWLGPVAYIQAEDALKAHPVLRIRPIAKPERYGNGFYSSEIIVRKDSGYEILSDLAGRKMAFVDPESTSGYLLAAAHLVQNGISERDPLLTRPHFVYQYGNVVLGVLFGKFAAGAVFEGAPRIFLKGPEESRLPELRVLARSESVPYEPIAAVTGRVLTDGEADEAGRLFLTLTERPDILKKLQVGRFVPAASDEYKSIRKIRDLAARIRLEDDTDVKAR